MAFTVKNWEDDPSTATPINAAALEDLETRVTDYTDQEVPGAKGTRVYRTTSQSIPNATWTAITWEAEEYDDDGLWSSGSGLTVVTAGLYVLSVTASFAVGSGGVHRLLRILRDRSSVLTDLGQGGLAGVTIGAGAAIRMGVTVQGKLQVGDVVTVQAYHDRGSATNIDPTDPPAFTISRIG